MMWHFMFQAFPFLETFNHFNRGKFWFDQTEHCSKTLLYFFLYIFANCSLSVVRPLKSWTGSRFLKEKHVRCILKCIHSLLPPSIFFFSADPQKTQPADFGNQRFLLVLVFIWTEDILLVHFCLVLWLSFSSLFAV